MMLRDYIICITMYCILMYMYIVHATCEIKDVQAMVIDQYCQ